jgi:hypothetical protein
MRIVNDVRTATLGRTSAGQVEGVVRARGFEAGVAGRGVRYERIEPEAVVIRGEDDLQRISIRGSDRTLSAVALPVLAYIAARVVIRRRRGR